MVGLQAGIEGMGIMLQKNSAPPPAGMPMPSFPEPARPETVLVGGAGGPGGMGVDLGLDPNSLSLDDDKSNGNKRWFGSGLFSQ